MKIDLENAIIFDGDIYVPDKSRGREWTQCKRCDFGPICACVDERHCNLFEGYPFKQVGSVNPDALDLLLSK